MADYYPLIAKAVAGLEKNTGEARRTLYERARGALVAQLRSVTPALSESEITRERLALEEAIRKVEADAARRARAENAAGRRSPEPPRPGETAPRRAGDTERPSGGAAEARPSEGEQLGERPVGRRESGDRASLRDQGLKGFRDVVAEAESLGDATAQASKSAREAFAAASPTRDAPRMEPHMEPDALRPPPRRPPRPPMREPQITPPDDGAPRKGEAALLHEAARGEPPRPGERDRPPWAGAGREPPESSGPTLPSGILPDEEPGYAPGHDLVSRERGRPSQNFDEEGGAAGGRPSAYGPMSTDEEAGAGIAGVVRTILSNRSALVGAAILILVLCLGGILLWQWPAISGLFKSTDVATAPVPSAPAPAPASKSKLTDRIGAPGAAPESKQQEGANVAQRVVLYEEDPANPAGKRHVGTAIWRLESASAGPGQPADPVVRADIEIPEPHITVKWSLRRNTDKALPASHTIEIAFTLPPDFPNGTIANIPGILMKQAEQTRGIPLAGLSVKVTSGFFLIGLSSTDVDVKRNIQLLKERAWFDIPIVYTNNRRAILAIEKGNPGDRVFEEAFKAWGE